MSVLKVNAVSELSVRAAISTLVINFCWSPFGLSII